MNYLKLSLIIAGILLLASCNGQNVTPSPTPDIQGAADSLDACSDPTMELSYSNSSVTSSKQEESQHQPEPPDSSEEEPGCILPELDN
jgi:hypothetical protein